MSYITIRAGHLVRHKTIPGYGLGLVEKAYKTYVIVKWLGKSDLYLHCSPHDLELQEI